MKQSLCLFSLALCDGLALRLLPLSFAEALIFAGLATLAASIGLMLAEKACFPKR